ncbi:hypothetical protein P7K49_033942 [Saguinus oedipus]|uniref:Uncharacterized protein n=1 Tax=Saguinus oedipus TaxID=9490 RepID=A0ABQ9TU68_SAGOE|nr:hypothetical protein P7K49_033942 [Saguinus oedipus]
MMGILLKTAIPAEITQVLVIQEIMHHHDKIILTVNMVIPVHVMTIHQEAIAIEMDMVVIVTIQIIQVEVPTEIHMRVMVTHVVFHLHEGPFRLMVEAVAMMITAAHVTDMVEIETVTQPAKVICTQVVVIGLADKKEGFPLLWKGGTLFHEIPTAVQATEHQEVVAVEKANLIEGEAEADTRNKQNFRPKSQFKETNKKCVLLIQAQNEWPYGKDPSVLERLSLHTEGLNKVIPKYASFTEALKAWLCKIVSSLVQRCALFTEALNECLYNIASGLLPRCAHDSLKLRMRGHVKLTPDYRSIVHHSARNEWPYGKDPSVLERLSLHTEGLNKVSECIAIPNRLLKIFQVCTIR